MHRKRPSLSEDGEYSHKIYLRGGNYEASSRFISAYPSSSLIGDFALLSGGCRIRHKEPPVNQLLFENGRPAPIRSEAAEQLGRKRVKKRLRTRCPEDEILRHPHPIGTGTETTSRRFRNTSTKNQWSWRKNHRFASLLWEQIPNSVFRWFNFPRVWISSFPSSNWVRLRQLYAGVKKNQENQLLELFSVRKQ